MLISRLSKLFLIMALVTSFAEAKQYFNQTVISSTTATQYLSGNLVVYENVDKTTSTFELRGGSITKSGTYLGRNIATDGAKLDAISISTGTNYSAIQSTYTYLNSRINSIAVSTGTIQSDLATEVSNRALADSAIGVSTGTIKASLDAVILSTGILQADINTRRPTDLKVSLSTEVVSALPASSISAGSLPSTVIASSVAVNSISVGALQSSTSSYPYDICVTSAIYAYNGGGGTGSGIDTVPVGTIMTWVSTSTIPTDYLYANGQAVSRSTYSSLFAVIGTQFGTGDGSTTFNVPDGRGMFLRGLDNGRGLDDEANRVIGSTETDKFQDHEHNTRVPSGYYGSGTGFANGNNAPDGADGARTNTIVTGLVGGTPRTGIETRPKNLAIAYIIKYQLNVSTTSNALTTANTWTQPQTFANEIVVVSTITNLTVSTLNTGGKTWQMIGSTTTSVACSSLTITGLDGNTDRVYKIIGWVYNPTTTSNIEARPNGLYSNMLANYLYWDDGTAPTRNQSPRPVVMQAAGSGYWGNFETTFNAGIVGSSPRSFRSDAHESMTGAGGSYGGRNLWTVSWNDVTTNVTYITFHASTGGNSLGAGTYFEIWARR